MKIKFIALDTNSYIINDSVDCVSLNWKDSISDWVKLVKDKLRDINESDIVIGHSIGASVALIVDPKCKMELYSPSPVFQETKHLLSDDMKKDLGSKLFEIEKYSLKSIYNKPDIFIGEKELSVMKKTSEIIKKNLNCNITYIDNADHTSVINKSGLINLK